MDTEPIPRTITNRAATGSLTYALLTVLSFCIGAAPIPLSSLVCYPASLVLALLAVFTGAVALRQIRLSGEAGRGLAWAGIWLGGLAILAVLAAGVLAAVFYPTLVGFLRHTWGGFR
jgi:hypothetical protein